MSQLIGYLSEGEQLKGSLTIPQQLGGSTLGSKTITANGVYDATDDGLDGYDVVTANVPNTYAAGDEGKVVDNGALVSQTTATYTVNNTYDTTKIKSVTVNVGGGSPTLETITKTYTPSTSQQTDTITPGIGYDGIAEVDVTVNAMPSGTEGTPTATKGAVSNHSVNVTPSVTNVAGYIAGGTKTGTAVTVSASELDSGTKSITANGNNQDVVGYATVDVAVPNSYSQSDEGKVVSNGTLVTQTAHADVTPTTSDQTIDTTLNNSLNVKGDADLVAGNIKKDVEIFGVTGSYEGGGGALPSAYTSRNYIQTAGNAYIDIGIKEFPTVLTGFKGRFSAYNSGVTGAKSLWGYAGAGGTGATTYRFIPTINTSNELIYTAAASGDSSTISGWDSNGINDISVSFTDNATYPVFIVNNTTTTGNKKYTTSAAANVNTFYLLARNSNGSPSSAESAVDGSWIRCYGFKVYAFGGLVRDYVPCTRNSDSVAGFYDFITEAFYPSIGENAFTYG